MRARIATTTSAPSEFRQALERVNQARREKWMYPEHVPLKERRQVFLPDFTVALVRTPFMPPRFATFQVPLEFNKLDLKDYLKNAYNVDTLKIRSYVEQQQPTRNLRFGKMGYGPLRRPKSKKRMMVELAEPFVWPPRPDDVNKKWGHNSFFRTKKSEDEYEEMQQDFFKEKKPEKAMKMFAEQAKAIREGQQTWKPTWQTLGLNFERPMLPEHRYQWAKKMKEQQEQTEKE